MSLDEKNEEQIIWNKNLVQMGGSLAILIPIEIIQHMQWTKENELCVCLDKGRHGEFVSIWKKGE